MTDFNFKNAGISMFNLISNFFKSKEDIKPLPLKIYFLETSKYTTPSKRNMISNLEELGYVEVINKRSNELLSGEFIYNSLHECLFIGIKNEVDLKRIPYMLLTLEKYSNEEYKRMENHRDNLLRSGYFQG